MDASLVRQAFMKLKPLCDSFVKDPQKKMLQAIMKQCQNMVPEVLQDVHTYVLFPFLVHLKNPDIRSRHDLLFSLVEGMHDILSKTHLENFDLYQKYFATLVYQIFDKNCPGTVSVIDEDFALLVIKTITVLTLRLPNDMRAKLYTRENAPGLGQGIYLCVQIAKREKYKALRLEALNCIMALCTVHDLLQNELHTPKLNQKLGKCVGDVLMFFLPGLMGGLQDIAKGDPKQGISITCLAIQGISRILCLVMMDLNINTLYNKSDITEKDFMRLMSAHNLKITRPKEEPDPFGKKLRAKGHDGMMEHLEKARRDKEWYEAAGDKLILLIKSLVPVQSHEHEKVRLELALLCYDIVFYCPHNMHQSLKYILEIIITLSEDSDPKVSATSRTAMEYFSHRSFNQNKKQLYDVLEDNFMCVLTKMPRSLNSLDYMKRLSGLNIFKGYLRLLTVLSVSPQGLTKTLCCSHLMTRFTIVLIDIFKMESSNIKLLDEFAVRDVEASPSDSCPWKIFTHLDNEMCLRSALHSCDIIGASEAVEMIVDYLLEQFREGSDRKKEIIMVLNEIVSASSPMCKEHLVKDIVTTYIEMENWYLPTVVSRDEKTPGLHETFDVTVYNPKEWVQERTYGLYEGATDTRYTDMSYNFRDIEEDENNNDDDFETCHSIAEAQNNIIKICLMTEGIGKMAKSLGVEFKPYLLKTLYLILERAGSGNELIHQAGMKALSDITLACQMTDITQLIKENADYFTHHVNLKLRKISDNSGVLDVLLVVMRYSESDVLPCLYDIVSNVLIQCRSLEEQSNVTLYLRLFYTFIKYIGAKFPPEELPPKPTELIDDSIHTTIIQELMEYQEILEICLDLNDFEADNNGKTVEEMFQESQKNREMYYNKANEEPEKKPLPIHIEMVVSVLKKTLNFIPSNDREQKLLALDIIKEGILVIKDYENELLPVVHLVWSPLVNRFKETSQPLIIHRSFKLLVTLANVSKEFIRHRTTKEVLSKICEYLVKSAQDSYMKDVGSSYRFTQAYKLQMTLLEELGNLCISLNLQEKMIYEIMCAAQVYLKCKQPKPLQDACIGFFKTLMTHNQAACWLHLKGLWNSGEAEPGPELPEDMEPLQSFTCSLREPHNKLDFQQCVSTLMECF